MPFYQILFHGQFAEGGGVSCEGFYTARIIGGSDLPSAAARGKELIRAELDDTLLNGRPADLLNIDIEEWEEIEMQSHHKDNRKGFTFY